jgi:CheY-like chemotaxis protein
MAKMVLIVKDNAVIRQALCRRFTSEADFDVCGEAENGRDAIEKAQALPPDLIVLDLSMPVMNGIDAARALKTEKILDHGFCGSSRGFHAAVGQSKARALPIRTDTSSDFETKSEYTCGASLLVREHIAVVAPRFDPCGPELEHSSPRRSFQGRSVW